MFHTDHDIAWQDARFRHANMLLDDIPCCRGLVMSLMMTHVVYHVSSYYMYYVTELASLHNCVLYSLLLSRMISITPANLVVDI